LRSPRPGLRPAPRPRHPATTPTAATAAAIALAALLSLSPLTLAADPAANTPDPLAGVQCILSGGTVVGGPCAIVNGAVSWQTSSVDNLYLAAINKGRAADGLAAIALPTSFSDESPNAQLLTLLNTERTDRGLQPVATETSTLDQAAATGAANRTDPDLGQINVSWGSVWGEGASALQVWFEWVYADGWGGSAAATPNLDCTSPTASGCWGHRHVLLGSYSGTAPNVGIAVTQIVGGQISAAIVLTQGTGRAATATASNASGFTDLGSATWAIPAITALHTAGAVNGTGPATFSPASPVTVAQLATMTGRLFHWPSTGATAPAGTPSWAAAALAFATAQGYLSPTTPPLEDATRGTAASLLAAALGWTGGAQTAASQGLICGTGAGLDLGGSLTRAQAAELLYRAAWIGHPASWGVVPATYTGNELVLGNPASPSLTQAFAAGC
jgi:hypothetical protein